MMDQIKALNAVCPYYTMYPLTMPLETLRKRARRGQWVLDPFCGRGTTNYAARLLGLPSIGIDSSPIAVAIAQAKLASATPSQVLQSAERILSKATSVECPRGKFWNLCYHASTLNQICKIRAALLDDCRSDARKLLRAIVMGALHGPRTRFRPSHLSNQCPRTFAPKPAYATRFWERHQMQPPRVDLLAVVRERATRYLSELPGHVAGEIVQGDSRLSGSYADVRFSFVITSPPYFGMRTYIPDQWLRNWFMGGPSYVEYCQSKDEVSHKSAREFAAQLKSVWEHAASHSADDGFMLIRFGGINDRKAEPLEILRSSLANTAWRIKTIRNAGDANHGRRQAKQFGGNQKSPLVECDLYATLN